MHTAKVSNNLQLLCYHTLGEIDLKYILSIKLKRKKICCTCRLPHEEACAGREVHFLSMSVVEPTPTPRMAHRWSSRRRRQLQIQVVAPQS